MSEYEKEIKKQKIQNRKTKNILESYNTKKQKKRNKRKRKRNKMYKYKKIRNKEN